MKINERICCALITASVLCTLAAAADRSPEGPRPVGPRLERSEREKEEENERE